MSTKKPFYNFAIPGLAETSTTLKQSWQIRLIPWLLVASSILSFFLYSLPRLLSTIHTATGAELLFYSLNAVYFLLAIYYLASRLKHGDMFFIWIVRIMAAYGLLDIAFFFFPPYSVSNVLNWVISILVHGYVLFGLIRYQKEIKEAGKSFKEVSSFNAKRDRLNRWLGIVLVVVLPVLIYLFVAVFLLAQLRYTHQVA